MWKTSSLNPKYEVNELGQVRHKQKKNILKGSFDKDGYIVFSMYDEYQNRKDQKAHVLIATEFVNGQTEERHFINHKNFNKEDNRAENLEWVTHQENMEHWRKSQSFYTSANIPTQSRESKFNKGKCPVIQYDLSGEPVAIYESYMAAERATHIRNGNISSCCQGKRKTAGGFIWRDLVESSTTIKSSELKTEQVEQALVSQSAQLS